jgi:hypothetical protein
MSEVAEATSEATPVVATPEAVVAVPAVAVPVVDTPVAEPAVVERPRGPGSKQEIERGIRDRAKKRAEEARAAQPAADEPAAEPVAEPAVDPAVDPAVAVDGEPAAEPAVAPDVAPAAEGGEPVVAGAEPVVEPSTPSFITVPIDPTHPSSQGQSEMKFADELSARVFKAYKNNNAKQNQMELKAAQAELAETREENARTKEENARLHDKDDRSEADKLARTKWESTPEYATAKKEYAQNIEYEANGALTEGTAKSVWEARMNGYKATVDVEYQAIAEVRANENRQKNEAQREATLERWTAEAKNNQSYLAQAVREHPQYPTWFRKSVKSFNDALQEPQNVEGLTPNEDGSYSREAVHAAFNEHFRVELFRYKAAREAMQSGQIATQQKATAATERAAAEQRKAEDFKLQGREEYKAELAARRSDVPPPNPIGNLAGVSRDPTPRAPTDDGQPPSTGRASKSAAEDRIRERARLRREKAGA